MILLHVAYHNIENCLHRLKRIMVFNPEDISSELQSYFTEESPMVSEFSISIRTCYKIVLILSYYCMYLCLFLGNRSLCCAKVVGTISTKF